MPVPTKFQVGREYNREPPKPPKPASRHFPRLSSIPIRLSLLPMAIELTKLALGLLILLFHRPIADFVLEQDRLLIVLFRQRGILLPATPAAETARNIYFGLGTFVAVYQLVHIWSGLRP
jgi:hypothetical protein